MNIINRLNNLEEQAAVLVSKGGKNFSIMFKDNNGVYGYQLINGEKVRVYPTQEDLNEFQKNHKIPIIIFDACLDLEG